MKISVIVPVYNVSKYLSFCIESIINQTYKNLEIVLINDGSSDDSGKICDKYAKKDERIKVIHQKNMGVSNTRNLGIKLSSGEYLTFVDSDDVLNYKCIELLISKISENTFVMGKISLFEKEILNNNNRDKDFELSDNNLIILAEMRIINSPCCRLYNTKILKDNNILFDNNLSLGEDLLFNLEYMNYVNRVYILNQNLYYYRRLNNDSLSSKYNKNMKEIQLLLFDKFTSFFEKKIMNIDQIKMFDSYRFGLFIIILQNEFRNKELCFGKRYYSCHKIMSSKDVKERIKQIKYNKNRLDYFLVSRNFILLYKIVNRIRNK